MQAVQRTVVQPPPVKIYNAVYSSVQVYECMVRGIAVMRRRGDSYVNATQILKVAGVDKGRRTKILEKEIHSTKHEIVQGGYGKYQGTWIPLAKGRELAMQYGVAPLLAPLFDFTPNANSVGSLPGANSGGVTSPRPPSASSSYGSAAVPGQYLSSIPSGLAPPPILPGSALRLLNQGRAQGLFTPTTSGTVLTRSASHASLAPNISGGSSQPVITVSTSISSPSAHPLKRNRSEADADSTLVPGSGPHISNLFAQPALPQGLDPAADIQMSDGLLPSSAGVRVNGEGPSPAKRLRKEAGSPSNISWQLPFRNPTTATKAAEKTYLRLLASSPIANGKQTPTFLDANIHSVRFASKPSLPHSMDPSASLKDTRRAAILAAICQRDDPKPVLDILREISADNPIDVDSVIDDQGHTALHLATSMSRLRIVQTLLMNGACIHRGNYLGETPLIRACLATHCADQQTFHILVSHLDKSIRTLDTSRKSVIHHVVSLAGVKGRAVAARYYLDRIFLWIAENQGGDFKSIVDLQDEHGDTALNIAARVGNRSLVRTLLDVGADRLLPNRLGLRPGDFGVEIEELSGALRAEDILSSLRSGPPAIVQKSQDVISDMTAMIQELSAEFSAEIKGKQDALDVTQAHLRAATRELSEQRKQIQAWQARCGELDQLNQRIRNVDKALKDEDQFDWTGRTDLDGKDARQTAGPAFQLRGHSSTIVGMVGSMDISFNVDTEPPIPTTDSVSNLVRLRRLKMWQTRMEDLMVARLKSLQGASAEKEYQCKKIVALCTGIPIDKVEDMLENLVIAVESEPQIVDIGRVSGFMQKVRDGII